MGENTYIIRMNETATADDKAKIAAEIVASGGTIEHEYTLLKAFAVRLPETSVSTFSTNPLVEVEKDQEVTTQ
ncbi:uncharacterized protein V1510DRAFT_414791 [Dipodascopsis tothii]|uniref:uncharacterized protein n=1 Tax=Dipodascopsis tothii TaxID=44089 RepID=UPI0034CD0F79